MNHVFQVWCEWDINLEHVVFASEENAILNAREALKNADIEEPFENLHKHGYIGIRKLDLL